MVTPLCLKQTWAPLTKYQQCRVEKFKIPVVFTLISALNKN